MRLILGEPALLAHSQLRYADVDRVVAAHVARRTGVAPAALVPRLVATSTRAAATTAFEVWLAGGGPLADGLRRAFDELAAGFPALLRRPRLTSPATAVCTGRCVRTSSSSSGR